MRKHQLQRTLRKCAEPDNMRTCGCMSNGKSYFAGCSAASRKLALLFSGRSRC